MIRVELEPSYVLHLKPYRETSYIVYALTLNHGVIHLITRGARTKNRSLIQPFAQMQLSWSGRGDLYSLGKYEYIHATALTDFRQKLSALYMNELIIHMVPRGSPSPDLFELYAHCLAAIADGQALAPLLREYECRLLNIVGHPLQLDYDVATDEPIRDDSVYRYEPNSGPRRVNTAADAWDIVAGTVLRNLREGQYTNDIQGAMKRFLRGVIHYHLNGKVIRSRDIMGLLE